ncbi:oxamate carbamoyltransferase subunit AllH family protein [Moorella naiadis (nom. illeg.)]|uniref:oxamate carbamoyltransferase subunit AllH family protein n=1 Tax=Moorella naiadis (nom. illeg.) TaxID=3093670 RepID=UPI003D9C9500
MMPGRPYCCRAIRCGRYFYQLLQETSTAVIMGLTIPTGEVLSSGDQATVSRDPAASKPGSPQVTTQTIKAGGYVHSVFHRVINFYLGSELFALAGPEKGNAAAFIIIDLPENINFCVLGIRQDLPVTLAGGWLRVGDALEIDCRGSIPWQGRRPEELRWEGEGLAWANVAALGQAISRWGTKGGVGYPAGRHNPYQPVVELLEQLRAGLLGRGPCRRAASAVDESNKPCYLQGLKGDRLDGAVNGLLGYGPGLTPSGDDLLLGLLAATSGGTDYQEQLAGLHRAIADNLKRTNTISAFFLGQALGGDYHEYVQEVVYAVINGIPTQVTAMARRLLGLGATSGTDIARGIYLGFSWVSPGDWQAAGH